MHIALFDLDHTVLEGDSDQLWGDFLHNRGLVDASYQAQKDAFYHDYCSGALDIQAFIEFCGQTLCQFSSAQLLALGREFQQAYLMPHLRPKAIQQINWHRARNEVVILISATNQFLVGLSAVLLGCEYFIASELVTEPDPESSNDDGLCYLPKLSGTAAFREGKVTRINTWLAEQSITPISTIAYSDSHNDLPLLQWADQAVAVNPDTALLNHAIETKWRICDWRHTINSTDIHQPKVTGYL